MPETVIRCLLEAGEVDELWDCPCRPCTALQWEVEKGSSSLTNINAYRRTEFPEWWR